MNRHKSMLIITLIAFALTTLVWGAQAQSSLIAPGDVLIYSRLSEQQGQYIRLSSDFRQVYNIPQDKCSLKSPNGTYVAESPLPGNNGELVVRRLDSQTTIIQTPWQATWDACYIVWSTDSVLSIRQQGTQQDYFNFDVSSSNLVPVSDPYSPPQYPTLPGWLPQSNQNFILPSPQSDIFLYERCPTGQVNAGNNCEGITDFVIYDAGQQQVLHVLQNPDGELIRGYDPTDPLRQNLYYPGAVWSATGRYLAFQRYKKTPYDNFTLMVYDLTSTQYVNMDWINAQIDYQRALQWSPQGNKLALWKIGRIGEAQPSDLYDTLRTPVIFDADTAQFLLPDQPFNMDAQGGGVDFTWSPDGQSLIFVDGSGNLMDMDVSSGTTTVLDTQVHEVVTWKHESTAPTSTPTNTVTPTPTATNTPGSGFPTSGVLDDFNRADGAIGINWSGITGGYTLANNQLDVGSGREIFWTPTAFGADQEAYVTLVTIDPASTEIDLVLKSQSASTPGSLIEVWYQPSSSRVQVWTNAASTQGWVQRGSDITGVTFAAGDQFGARATANGIVEVYKNGILLGSRDVSAWPYYANGGYVGLWFINSSNTILDNFGGGNLPGATLTPTPTASITATPSPTSTPPPGSGTGLLGHYYDTSTLTTWILSRVDSVIDFDWGSGSPNAAMGADTFSVRWTGQVVPQYSQTYTFYTQSDDGVRLWVNNQLLIDNWTDHVSAENSGTIALSAGTRYDVRMEYYENTNGAIARLSWSSASQSKQVIPTGRLLPNGRIVFQTNRDGNDEIYSMNADGSGPVNLTNDSGSDTYPAVLAGTQKIVFASSRTGNYEIDSMALTGGTVTNLTNVSSYDHYPSQAPDGRIAFASTRNGGNFNIWTMPATGGAPTQLTSSTGTERYSTWSPDGQWIIYDSEENGVQDLWKISAAGGTPTRLTQNAAYNSGASWSPDGTTIVFHTTRNAGAHEIYLMNASGGDQRPFRTGGLNGFDPVWSPDGTYITYHAWASGQPEVFIIALGSTTPVNLTNNSVVDGYPGWGAQ